MIQYVCAPPVSLTSLAYGVGVKLITFCKNINFGSLNIFSYGLYLGQAVSLCLHACSQLSHVFFFGFFQFQHLLDDKEDHKPFSSAPIVFEDQSIYSHFLTFRLWCLCECWIVLQVWLMTKGSHHKKVVDQYMGIAIRQD